MSRRKGKALAAAVAVTCVFGGFAFMNASLPTVAEEKSSYVELYSPLDDIDVVASNAAYFSAAVKDDQNTDSGKGLSLSYTVSASAVSVTLPITVERKTSDFAGLALWLDVPETADEYSFTMRIENTPNALQYLRAGKTLTLINQDGTVTEQTSVAKHLYLNGFTGWLMIPKTAYLDATPNVSYEYKVTFSMEAAEAESAIHTQDLEITLGSLGYYTEYNSFLLEKGGEDALEEKALNALAAYVGEIEALEPEDDGQAARKADVLTKLNELKDSLSESSAAEKLEKAQGLRAFYRACREEYLYGDIMETGFLTSFAITSDVHHSSTWVNTYFEQALQDAKTLNPDLSNVVVLGDLSDQGVSLTDPSYTDLDDYYDWLDAYTYQNSKGEDVTITNILGNHDVRGSSGASDGRTAAAYEAAVATYKAREGVESIQFDKWIDGYHFIFLNTDQYHKDDCYLSAETLTWLDEKLGENEDGRPIFVMIHQPIDRVHEMEGATTTFQEVIARHPSAIVSSGHTHSPFGTAVITQEGNGTYINQPSMKSALVQYYYVEIYEGGVVYRAREAGTDDWKFDSYVVIRNDDRTCNELFSADTYEGRVTTENATASIVSADSASGNALRIVGAVEDENVSVSLQAVGEINNYAGYAVYITSDAPVSLSVNEAKLKSSVKYYTIVEGELVGKISGENGEIQANGWVILPKDIFESACAPSKSTTFTVVVGATQTVELDKICYYFDFDAFTSLFIEKDDELQGDENVESNGNDQIVENGGESDGSGNFLTDLTSSFGCRSATGGGVVIGCMLLCAVELYSKARKGGKK